MVTYDCSQPLESGMPVYPGDDPVAIEQFCTVPADGSCMREIACTTHTGTHIDAPSHKIADGPTLDDYDVSTFRFRARLVDCTPREPRERIGLAALPPALKQSGPASDREMVVFQTGWSDHWGTDRYQDSPYLAADLVEWCVEHGCHVGIDTFSPDPVPSVDPERESADEPTDQPAHAALCGNGRFIVENLRGLDRLPEQFVLDTRPLAIVDTDGSPVRAVAHTGG